MLHIVNPFAKNTAPQSEVKKPRNHAFDLLCGICIVRMMMLHITEECGMGSMTWWREIMHWSYYFMSFFFFKAGYFNKTVSGDSRAFIVGKFKSLMFPYFVWGAVGSMVYMFFVLFVLPPNNYFVRSVQWEHLWSTSGWYGNGPTWFLFSFFTAYVAMHLISKIPSCKVSLAGRSIELRAQWLVVVFPWISYWLCEHGNPLWLDLNNVFWGIFLFFLGRVWRITLDTIRGSHALILSTLMVAGFIALNYADQGEYAMSHNIWTGTFPITFAKIVLSLCGLSGMLITLHVPAIPVLDYIGRHSMVYFVGHYPLLVFYKMTRSANVRTLNGHWDDWIILTFFLFALLTLLVPHVERVPWISGRWPKK